MIPHTNNIQRNVGVPAAYDGTAPLTTLKSGVRAMANERVQRRHVIYKVTCLVEGVGEYVGRSMHLEKRVKQHRRTRKGTRLRAAIDLFGEKAFCFEEIASCDTVREAKALEQHYIQECRTWWPLGLNLRETNGRISVLEAGMEHYEVKKRIADHCDERGGIFDGPEKSAPYEPGFYLYCIIEIATGLEYFGSTNNPRKRFCNHIQTKSKSKLAAAMRRDGREAFRMDVLARFDTKADACAAERKMIRDRNSIWPNGFNLHGGGKGTLIQNLPPEERAKRTASLRGRILSDETKQRIKDAWQRNYAERVAAITAANNRVQAQREEAGVPHPSKGKPSKFKGKKRGAYGQSRIKADTGAKRSASLKAAYADPEARQKLSEIAKNRWSDPEFRKRRADGAARALKDPAKRERYLAAMKVLRADPVFEEKRIAALRAAFARKKKAES